MTQEKLESLLRVLPFVTDFSVVTLGRNLSESSEQWGTYRLRLVDEASEGSFEQLESVIRGQAASLVQLQSLLQEYRAAR